MTGRDMDPYIGRAFLGDGVATMVSGSVGGTGVTTYAENIGVMAATRIYSTALFVVAALFAILLGFSPKFGALIHTIPLPAMGGVSIVIFGLITIAGARIWVDNKVDFARQPQHDGGGHHPGSGHRRLHAEVRWLCARRHRHRDLRRPHPECAAQLRASLASEGDGCLVVVTRPHPAFGEDLVPGDPVERPFERLARVWFEDDRSPGPQRLVSIIT